MILLLLACGNEHAIIDTSNDTQPVIELSCPQPEINLSCPEVVCPEPVVRDIVIETSCPDVYVEQPEVNITVDGPDMTGIESAIDDMVVAFEDLSLNGSQSSQTKDYHAQTGNIGYSSVIVFNNNDSREFVITSVIGLEISCAVKDSGGIVIPNFCSNLACSRTKSFSSAGVHASIGVRNGFSIPVEPGQFVECVTSNSSQYLLQGYYQN